MFCFFITTQLINKQASQTSRQTCDSTHTHSPDREERDENDVEDELVEMEGEYAEQSEIGDGLEVDEQMLTWTRPRG